MQLVVSASLRPAKSRQNSFTLVELLVVIAIIGILVAITLGAASGVMQAAARNRAKSEIQAMSTALEGYKNDNGAYPSATGLATNSAGGIAYTSVDGTGVSTYYLASSQVLYQALSGKINYLDDPAAGIKAYATFKANQLGNVTATKGSPAGANSTYVQDPWSYSYGYSTGNTTNSYPYNGNGFFDLWSTAGLTTASKNPYLTNTASWISNWQ